MVYFRHGVLRGTSEHLERLEVPKLRVPKLEATKLRAPKSRAPKFISSLHVIGRKLPRGVARYSLIGRRSTEFTQLSGFNSDGEFGAICEVRGADGNVTSPQSTAGSRGVLSARWETETKRPESDTALPFPPRNRPDMFTYRILSYGTAKSAPNLRVSVPRSAAAAAAAAATAAAATAAAATADATATAAAAGCRGRSFTTRNQN